MNLPMASSTWDVPHIHAPRPDISKCERDKRTLRYVVVELKTSDCQAVITSCWLIMDSFSWFEIVISQEVYLMFTYVYWKSLSVRFRINTLLSDIQSLRLLYIERIFHPAVQGELDLSQVRASKQSEYHSCKLLLAWGKCSARNLWNQRGAVKVRRRPSLS